MKRRLTLAIALAVVPVLAAPAMAQSYSDQRRWESAQQRYQSETNLYQRERDRYFSLRGGNRGGYDNQNDRQYGNGAPLPPPPGYNDDSRFVTTYDASRDYREDPRYQERQLSTNDQVYRGSDGRYYCKRNDGTTGLIVGAAGGGVLGNVLDGGRHRTAGTLLGGALGALAGRAIEQNNDMRCR